MRKAKVDQLACLSDSSDRHNRVYSVGGVSPTLQAAMGKAGGNIPLIPEIRRIG